MQPSSDLPLSSLNAFPELGTALWADPEVSWRNTLETVAAVGSLPGAAPEKAAVALLQRALREGTAQNTERNFCVPGVPGRPFYRLPIEHRFILTALYRGH